MFTLHKHQDVIIAAVKRFIIALSGIQGGKTTIGAIWLCHQLQKDRDRGKYGDYLLAAPTVKILQQSTLPKFREIFPSDWGEWKEQRQCFDLSWGGKIYVRSTEEPDHIEGMTILAAWLDEAGQMKEQAWINVQGRLSVNQGPCLMTTTPYYDGWFWDLVKLARDGNDEDYQLVSWRSIDNPGFPLKEYERAKRTLPKAIFERRYEGKLVRMEGLVYPDFDENNFADLMVIPGEWKRFAGMDFGHNHPTVILFIAEQPEVRELNKKTNVSELKAPSVFYVYREFYKSQALLRESAEQLNRETLAYTLGDPRAAQEIAELRRVYHVKHIHAADNKVDIGVERIAVLIKENRLKFIRKRVPHTINEIETYHFIRGGQDKPEKKHDDAMDALKYAFSRQMKSIYPKNSILPHRRRFSSRLATVQLDPYTGY